MRNFRTIRSALAATLATTALVGGSGAVVPAEATVRTTYSWQAKDATNDQRRRHERVPLDGNRCLKRFAARQAERMASQRRLFHQDLGPILRRCDMRMVGENVAVGFPSGRSVVNDGWMRSRGHRENILRSGFRKVAIGARKSGDTWYVAQVFGRR